MFWGASSTTRSLPEPAHRLARAASSAATPNLAGKRPDVDRLLQIGVEAGAEQALAVIGHREGSQGDDADRGGPRVRSQALERADAVYVGQLDVHQN